MGCSANVFKYSFIHSVVDKETKFYLIKGKQKDFDYLKMFGFHDFSGGRLYSDYFYVLLDSKWLLSKHYEDVFLSNHKIDISNSIGIGDFVMIFLREYNPIKIFDNYHLFSDDLIEFPTILALYYDSVSKIISYQKFIFRNVKSIQNLLPNCNGNPLDFVYGKYKYCGLFDHGSFLLFLQDDESKVKSINHDKTHLLTAKDFASL